MTGSLAAHCGSAASSGSSCPSLCQRAEDPPDGQPKASCYSAPPSSRPLSSPQQLSALPSPSQQSLPPREPPACPCQFEAKKTLASWNKIRNSNAGMTTKSDSPKRVQQRVQQPQSPPLRRPRAGLQAQCLRAVRCEGAGDAQVRFSSSTSALRAEHCCACRVGASSTISIWRIRIVK